jgi:hypothetical protein
MTIRPDSLSADGPVSVNTGDASGTFHRTGPTSARLELEYTTADLEVAIEGDDITFGVLRLCEREVTTMRAMLSGLGEAIAGQLGDEGKNPVVSRHWRDRDERDWVRTGRTFVVRGSRARTLDHLEGYEGASDAKLVREHVRLVIEQREQSIRQLYAQILTDAQTEGASEVTAEESV